MTVIKRQKRDVPKAPSEVYRHRCGFKTRQLTEAIVHAVICS